MVWWSAIIKNTDTSDNYGCSNSPQIPDCKGNDDNIMGLLNAIIKITNTSDNCGFSNSPQITDCESNDENIMWFCEEFHNENTYPYW